MNFIPEFATISAPAKSKPFDEVQQTAWEGIIIGALASQVSGVERDCTLPLHIRYKDTILILRVQDGVQAIFPKLPKDEIPPCGTFPVCTRERKSSSDLNTLYLSSLEHEVMFLYRICFSTILHPLSSTTPPHL